MDRRTFVGSFAAGLLAVPLASRAQQRDRVRRIGVLIGFAESEEAWQSYLAAFRQRLQELGWTDGRNVRFDYRSQAKTPNASASEPGNWSPLRRM